MISRMAFAPSGKTRPSFISEAGFPLAGQEMNGGLLLF